MPAPDVFFATLPAAVPGGFGTGTITTDVDIPAGYTIVLWCVSVSAGGSTAQISTHPSFLTATRFFANATITTLGFGSLIDNFLVFTADTDIPSGSVININDWNEDSTTCLVFKNLRDPSVQVLTGDVSRTGDGLDTGPSVLNATLISGNHLPIIVFGSVIGTNFDYVPYADSSPPIITEVSGAIPPYPASTGMSLDVDFNVVADLDKDRSGNGLFSPGTFHYTHSLHDHRLRFWRVLLPGDALTLDPSLSGVLTTTGATPPPSTAYEFNGVIEGRWGIGWLGVAIKRTGSPPSLVRDYTGDRRLYYPDADGALQVKHYWADDTEKTDVEIDPGPDCAYPAFCRRDGAMVGTYLLGTDPKFAITLDHGNTFQLMDIPGTYDQSTSQEWKNRYVFLGFKADEQSWYTRVADVNRDGSGALTVDWSDEVEVVSGTASADGGGHLREASNGDLEFVYRDEDDVWQFLFNRSLALDGTGIWF